ncbi:hypothetical protein HPB47_024980, partial [Ixodes persulcatus]
ETTYDITLGYHGHDGSEPFNGYYYVNSKLNVPSRYVATLKTIPMLTVFHGLLLLNSYLRRPEDLQWLSSVPKKYVDTTFV